jgi:hypothetical protein
MHAHNVDVRSERKETVQRYRWFGLLALGFVLLLLVPWLQRAFWLKDPPGRMEYWWGLWLWGLRLPFTETALCIGIVLLGTAVGCVGEINRIAEKIASEIERRTIWLTAITFFAAVLFPLLAAWFVLDRFPNSGDEFSYLFQAETLARFRLWEQPPVLGTDLIPYHTWIFGSKWVGQYPPGWPIVLALGLLVGLPTWMMNAVVGGSSIVAITALCKRLGDRSTTVIAVALYTLTPFYVMNAASYFSHVFSSLLILILCLCLPPDGKESRAQNLIAAGAIIGLLAMTRYFSGLPLLPALLFWLVTQRPATWPRVIGWMAVGCIPFLFLLMIYQDAITGSPFRSTYFVINTPELFPSLEPSIIKVGTRLILAHMAELVLWASPILVIVYAGCLLLKFKERKLAYYDLIFPSFVLAYTIYAAQGANRYGPRYYFDAFPLLIVTIVSAIPSVKAKLDGPIGRAILPIASIACLLYLLGTWPLVLSGFRREVWSREEPFRLVAQGMLRNAVVILDAPSGPGLDRSDLVRNPPSMDAAVLYARSSTDIGALRNFFPERSIWRYSRPDPTRSGQLYAAPGAAVP